MAITSGLRDFVARLSTCWSQLCLRVANMQDSRRKSISHRATIIRESNIRDAARLVAQIPDIVNLGQGLPEYPVPTILKEAAQQAIAADINQYSNTWGLPKLREAIARK